MRAASDEAEKQAKAVRRIRLQGRLFDDVLIFFLPVEVLCQTGRRGIRG